MRHSLSLPTVTYICMGELPHFHHGPTSSFLHSQPIQTPPSGPGLICVAGQVFIWDDHATQLIFHQGLHSSTHYMVLATFFEVLSASVEPRKLFLDWSLCLAGHWPWSGCLGSSWMIGCYLDTSLYYYYYCRLRRVHLGQVCPGQTRAAHGHETSQTGPLWRSLRTIHCDVHVVQSRHNATRSKTWVHHARKIASVVRPKTDTIVMDTRGCQSPELL